VIGVWQMNICQIPVADEYPQPTLLLLAPDMYPVRGFFSAASKLGFVPQPNLRTKNVIP
jgi:hypothetical protein